MASSTRALAASLDKVADRLRRKLAGSDAEESETEHLASLLGDLEEDGVEMQVDEPFLGAPAESDATAPVYFARLRAAGA